MKTLDQIIDSIYEDCRQHDLEVARKRRERAAYLEQKYFTPPRDCAENHTIFRSPIPIPEASEVIKCLRDNNESTLFEANTKRGFNVFCNMFNNAGFGYLITSLPEYENLKKSSSIYNFKEHIGSFDWGTTDQGYHFWIEIWWDFLLDKIK